MSRIPCEIIQDLLPLYVDDVCSAKSKICVEEHLVECAECRKYLQTLKGGLPMLEDDINTTQIREIETAFFKKIKHDINVEKYIFTSIVIICTLFGLGVALFLWGGALKAPKVVVFEDYQGPNLPLSLVNETEAVVADREIEVDYTDYKYPTTVGNNETRKVKISDKYILTNTTDEDVEIELAYGTVGDYGTNWNSFPIIKVDGEQLKAADIDLVVGRSALAYGSNKDKLTNREAFEMLLADGQYRIDALEAAKNIPKFSENVYVYEFEDIVYDGDDKSIHSVYAKVLYEYDPEKTQVYSYGCDQIGTMDGFDYLGFGIPAGDYDQSYMSDVYLIAIGDELTIQDVKYYKNLSIKELKDFSLEYKTYETTLDEILKEIVYENKQNHKPFMENAIRVYDIMKDEQILEVGKQHLADMRESNYQSKYAVWALEDYIFNLYGDTRVIYRTGKVMIPANESIEVTFDYEKFTGFKYIEEIGYDGLEIMTSLGSNLNIQNQNLKVVGLEQSIISEHTTGDELENGKREVNLDENCFEIYVKVPERKTNKKVNVYGYTSE